MQAQLMRTGPGMLEQAQAIFDLLDVSEGTRQDYKKSIKPFVEYATEQGIGINTFLNFKRFLKERKEFGTSTKNKYLISARIFLKEINKQGLMPVDITGNVKCFEQGRKHKRDGLNEVEVQRLCQSMHQIEDARLKAIFSLLIYQGLRQMEIIGMDMSDIDLGSMTAKITGKGKSDWELIHLHPQTVHAFRRYMDGMADGPLFINESNRGKGSRLTTRSLRRIVKNELNGLNINKTTHGFRHYFTTTLLEAFDGDMLRVRDLTRHKSFDMLSVYNDARLSVKKLPVYYEAFAGARL